ncbi:dynactin subunit 3 [Lethenteron reissneri]|uniref:dynactin subunit 3 n=1 Tax=Lethenteron reissneri TaxID=7753 RepID=UPI002AB70BBD|nr:dynactin subunit 3 [Lethenteron reissneri]
MADISEIEARIEALERALCGGRPPAKRLQCVDALTKIQATLDVAAGKRERVRTLFKKLDELLRVLEPGQSLSPAVPDSVKLQIILSGEAMLKTQAGLLEEVEQLIPLLESQSLQAIPGYSGQLQALTQVHVRQQDECAAVENEVKTLVEEYNRTLLLLSRQFVQWDEALTRVEVARGARRVLD